jgi:hypothetical protein
MTLKYGHLSGVIEVETKPVAASQYFYHDGVNLVYLDSSGQVTLALSATTTVYGIAIVPKGRGAGSSDSYWLSNAVAGVDKIGVIALPSPNVRFLFPASTTITTSHIGNTYDLVAVNDGASTYVNISATSVNIFVVDDLGTKYGGSATDAVVHINPAVFQAD